MLFNRYTRALASAPQNWFRMRDCDALARFTIASALACNDMDDVWYTEEQFDVLTEIGDTLYDAIAFYKHRAEGETNNTFAYMPEDIRVDAFRVCRELLWSLDTAYALLPEHQIVMNFVRFFGGPIHMMMRRYRFVEETLSMGRPENQAVIQQTRENFKLWNRIDAEDEALRIDEARYRVMIGLEEKLMFPGLADLLERAGQSEPSESEEAVSIGAKDMLQFSGVKLSTDRQETWRNFHESLPQRAKKAFPKMELDPSLPMACKDGGDI
jgi:hypothetical protein